MKKIRGAVIGCGFIAEYHLRAWQRIPEVEITALVDPVRDNAENRRAQFAPAARLYGSINDALAREALDFVDILSPPQMHAEQSMRAKAAGLHVICQKPLCDNLPDARDLVSAFADGSQLLCVHENHVYRPWFRRILSKHREGFFGSIRRLRLEQNDPTSPPQQLNREAERGVLLQYGTHLIDMARQLLGLPDRISAELQRINPEIRGESLALVTMSYPGCTATIEVAYKNGVIQQASAFVLGDRGEAFYEGTMTRGGEARFRLSQGSSVTVDEVRSTVDDYVESFYSLERAFIDALLQGTPAPQPASENLQTLALTFAAYAAAEQNKTIVFPEFAKTTSITISP